MKRKCWSEVEGRREERLKWRERKEENRIGCWVMGTEWNENLNCLL